MSEPTTKPRTTSRIVPCLWMDDQAEEAARFYTSALPEGRIHAIARYPETGANPAVRAPGSVLTVEFEVAGQRFTAVNGGPVFTMNPSLSFFVFVDTAAEADRLHAALVDGGSELMPLGAYPWSERYAWVRDRYGATWQITAGRREGGPVIVPCFMFAGRQHGRAAEAIAHYTKVFRDSEVSSIERYAEGAGPAGMVVHGRFTIAGQPMCAMDAHAPMDVDFDEGLSLQVMCRDQAEVDYYWDALAEGGRHVQCGWLADRFGFSWQVVPDRIAEWMTHPDPAARERAARAVWSMRKLDIATIEAALAGR